MGASSTDPAPVEQLLALGFAFPCACCTRLWRARAKGLDGCGPLLPRGQVCAGPIGGYSFPLYQGPLNREAIAMRCFRCGGPAYEAVSSTYNPEVLVGVCKDHVFALERLVPVERLPKGLAG